MNSVIELIRPSVVGRALVVGELREFVLAPPPSSRLDVDPAETLPVVTVGIVGLGYVGLPTALALLEAGVRVLGCDVSETRLAAIKAGQVDLLAADHDRLGRFVGGEELVLTTEPRALAAADVVVICVPTPVDEHLVPDLTALRGACESVVETPWPARRWCSRPRPTLAAPGICLPVRCASDTPAVSRISHGICETGRIGWP
jgi:hypothetical protein